MDSDIFMSGQAAAPTDTDAALFRLYALGSDGALHEVRNGQTVNSEHPRAEGQAMDNVGIDSVIDRSTGEGRQLASGEVSHDLNSLIEGHGVPFATVTLTDRLSGATIGIHKGGFADGGVSDTGRPTPA